MQTDRQTNCYHYYYYQCKQCGWGEDGWGAGRDEEKDKGQWGWRRMIRVKGWLGMRRHKERWWRRIRRDKKRRRKPYSWQLAAERQTNKQTTTATTTATTTTNQQTTNKHQHRWETTMNNASPSLSRLPLPFRPLALLFLLLSPSFLDPPSSSCFAVCPATTLTSRVSQRSLNRNPCMYYIHRFICICVYVYVHRSLGGLHKRETLNTL